jgi:phosphate-selective porin
VRVPCHIPVAVAALSLFGAGGAHGQSPESDLPAGAEPAPSPPGGYALPDPSQEALSVADIDRDLFSIKLGFVMMLDYSSIGQDQASIAQVGVQHDKAEIREARITNRGDLRFLGGWQYQVNLQFKGLDRDPTDTGHWTLNDVSLAHDFAFGTLTFGKIKQTFSYEMVAQNGNQPESERLLTPFFKSRDIGVRLNDTAMNERATWAVGVYDGDGLQASARVTMLPIWRDDGHSYLHIAYAVRYNSTDTGTLRFAGRPESNVTDLYVDTGDLPADHAWHSGFEALWASGPYSVRAEAVQAHVAANALGHPTFSGWYVLGSWTITGGGPRPYDRTAGYARRIPVTRRNGEIELVARYGRVDLDDGTVQGGTLDKWYFGANWWATQRWRLTLGYGDANLDRFDVVGNTRILLMRIQWIY